MDILRDFLETSTIHGLAYISNVPSKTGKAVWLTIVIAGFCTAGYLISDSFKEWDETPIDTSISTHPIATLPLPIITICPPENSNTALNLDLVRAGGINLTKADRQDLVNVSRRFFINKPSRMFVDVARLMTNEEAIPQLKAQTRSYPIPYENTNNNLAFEIWSTELGGSYTSPGFGLNRNCSKIFPDIHFTLYLPQKVILETEDLTNQTFDINIMTLHDEEFEVRYRVGDKYIYHGDQSEQKSWSDAENHCNQKDGHLVSIRTNYDYVMFKGLQDRDNKAGNNVWLGGSDRRVESSWEWSDRTPWANDTAEICSKVSNLKKHGREDCTHWAPQHPKGGRESNCLIVDRSQQWRSDYCDRKQK